MNRQPRIRPALVLKSALIVDDHPLFCDALSMTLTAVSEIVTVETADCMEAALARLSVAPLPDVIVLDLNLPDVNGFDGLTRMKTSAQGSPIMVVSSMADNRVISAAIKAGAAGFVPKHSGREVFRAALDTVARHELFVPDGYIAIVDQQAPATPREESISRLSLLTRQQARILELICEGMLNKQIAFTLSIAETTVKAHVTAIMRKLGVQSRTQAVLIAQDASFSNLLPENW